MLTDQPKDSERYIGRIIGPADEPAVVFFGGIHGNEPSGVIALRKAIKDLQGQDLKGSIYAVYGNKSALEIKKRFHTKDLNRLWTRDRVEELQKDNWKPKNQDEEEQLEIWNTIHSIMSYHTGMIYFIDLHTTSSETMPFVVLNDSLLNRAYVKQYPLPIILGIEEYLDGPLLSYINELGYIAFGFEAGSHDDPVSVDIHHAFVVCSLHFTGITSDDDLKFDKAIKTLEEHGKNMGRFYEIFYRYRIREGELFQMKPGYINFQPVKKGTLLAHSNTKAIFADQDALVFMPLYQSQGSEGFFAVRPINQRFLKLSAMLRKLGADRILPLLPGIRWKSEKREALIVNKSVARILAKQIFHLLGYRSRSLDRNYYILRNREVPCPGLNGKELPFQK